MYMCCLCFRYDQGRLLNKPNTFSDFIAATEHLIQGGWTSPNKLVAHGYSAGGMVLGAVANMRPDLFRVMLLKVRVIV
jgi:oligopeptidase B